MHYAIRCPNCGSQKVKKWEKDNTDIFYTYEQDEETITPEFNCLNCSEVFGCVTEDSDKLPQSHCVSFYFYVGEDQEKSKAIHFEKEDSFARLEINSPFQKNKKQARMPLTEWQNIKDDLFNQLFILSWQSDYKEAGATEGKQWEVTLHFDDRQSYVVKGFNAYPVLYVLLLELVNPYFEQLGFEKEFIPNKKE